MLSLSLSLSVPYSAAKLFPDRLLLLWLVLPQMSQSIALTRTTLNNAEKLDSLGPAWHTIVAFCSCARGTLLIRAEFHFARAPGKKRKHE
jgi:hypothetical protein